MLIDITKTDRDNMVDLINQAYEPDLPATVFEISAPETFSSAYQDGNTKVTITAINESYAGSKIHYYDRKSLADVLPNAVPSCRYIKFSFKDNSELNGLAELEIISGGVDVAVGKTVMLIGGSGESTVARVVNGDYASNWISSTGIDPQIIIDLGQAYSIEAINVVSHKELAGVIDYAPTNFLLEGSFENERYFLIDSITGQSWGFNEVKVFAMHNRNALVILPTTLLSELTDTICQSAAILESDILLDITELPSFTQNDHTVSVTVSGINDSYLYLDSFPVIVDYRVPLSDVLTNNTLGDFGYNVPLSFLGDQGFIVADTNYLLTADITTPGDSTTFGSLGSEHSYVGAAGDGVYGVIGGGYLTTYIDDIEQVVLSTPGNASLTGNLQTARYELTAANGEENILFAGGRTTINVTGIESYNPTTQGTASTFGVLGIPGYCPAAGGNANRVLISGGYPYMTSAHYVESDTPGDSQNFGLLSADRLGHVGLSSVDRVFFAGGVDAGTTIAMSVDVFTIATPADATMFGDLDASLVAASRMSGCSNGQRGVVVDNAQHMSYIEFDTPATSQVFGTANQATRNNGGFSAN